jgi:type IV pilus assembly protein PilW
MIELLVSAALTAILLGGVFAIILNSRASLAATSQISQRQLDGKRALDEISASVREAGFAGCARAPTDSTVTDAPYGLTLDSTSTSLRGYSAQAVNIWGNRLGERWQKGVVTNSDVMVVRRIRPKATPWQLERGMEQSTDDLVLDSSAPLGLNSGDMAMVYDCNGATIFTVSMIQGSHISHSEPLNRDASLGYAFARGAEVLPLEFVLYFVGRSPENPEEDAALWRQVNGSAPQRIASGVERLQLRFAEGSESRPTIYATSAEVVDWTQVGSVAIDLSLTAQMKQELIDSPNELSTVATLRNRPL